MQICVIRVWQIKLLASLSAGHFVESEIATTKHSLCFSCSKVEREIECAMAQKKNVFDIVIAEAILQEHCANRKIHALHSIFQGWKRKRSNLRFSLETTYSRF